MAENGGIVDDRYVTDPQAMAEGKKNTKRQIFLLSSPIHGIKTKIFPFFLPTAIMWVFIVM
jgi:hypothetical protein